MWQIADIAVCRLIDAACLKPGEAPTGVIQDPDRRILGARVCPPRDQRLLEDAFDIEFGQEVRAGNEQRCNPLGAQCPEFGHSL